LTSDEILAEPDTAEETERRTSYVELFFDLVFVFAITQVTSLLVADPSAGGFARAAIVLFLVYWAWGGYAWLTNAIDVDSIGVRVAYLVGMGASFVMALGVPRAYEDQGAWFVVPFLLVRVLHVVVYAWGLRGDRSHQRAVFQLAPWFLLAPAVVVVGGLVDDGVRPWIWAAAIVIDVVGALSVGNAGFRISPSHFAERYALFVIIALGESIVAIGVGAAELERDLTFAIGVAVAFAGVATLWWAYFDWPVRAMDRLLHVTPAHRRGPVARDVFSLAHYPIVLGIIFFAVAAKKTLEHPQDPLSDAGRAALGIGVAAYLVGFVLGRYRGVRRVAWERLLGAVVALAVALALDELDALALLAVVVGILALTTAAESLRLRNVRAELRAAAG
jgi:low temperature requirement protein LtrA